MNKYKFQTTKPQINRRHFLKKVSFTVSSMMISGCIPQISKQDTITKQQTKPNFIFIIIDDLGYKDVGFMGATFYETPNIDNLARQGVIFTNAYTNAPNCAPTRAAIISGQYTPRYGIYTVGSSERGKASLRKLIPISNKTTLDPNIITIAEALKPAGYTSACIGKWHLGNKHPFLPQDQGFDTAFHRTRRSHFTPDGQYLTDRLTDEAVRFIQQNKDKPFFLYLAHYAVHTPIQAKHHLIQKYKAKLKKLEVRNRKLKFKWDPTYAAMIESVDQSVGKIQHTLNNLQLTDHTIIFFFSDNGGYGPITSMAPLRGAKGMLYEGGIRVPMFIYAPKIAQPGLICHTPVIGIDFYPTILELADLPKPTGHILDGQSLIPLLTTKIPNHKSRITHLKNRAIFWHFPAYLEAYKGGISKGPWRTTPAGAIRQGDFKLIEFFEDGKLELYNLKEDISEENNLAHKLPQKTNQLHQLLINWRQSINAPIPTQKNPLYNPPPINK